MGIIRIIGMAAANKKQWANGISWWRMEHAVNKRNPAAMIRDILWVHNVKKRFLFWSSILKESVPIANCSQMWPSFFGKVIFPPSRINKKTAISVNTMNIKNIWMLPEYIKDAVVILPIREAINKITSWSPINDPTKEGYGKSYFFSNMQMWLRILIWKRCHLKLWSSKTGRTTHFFSSKC